MTRYAVLSCIVLLPSAPSVSAQALLDQTTYGNFAAGSVRGSGILAPGVVIVRFRVDPDVFVCGHGNCTFRPATIRV